MRFSVRQAGLALLCGLTFVCAPDGMLAQSVCTAADIEARDDGCPSGGDTCTITTSLTVSDGCTLDFGQRDLVVSPSGGLVVRTGAMTIRADSLTINGILDGRGTGPTDSGGMVRIAVTGTVAVQDDGRIDVSADDGDGTIMIEAAGSIIIRGRLRAAGNIGIAIGGNIVLRSEADLTATLSSQMVARGAGEGGGGLIDVTARGRVEIGARLDVVGADGGEINLYSGEDMVVNSVDAHGTTDAGSGGCVSIRADTSLQVLDVIKLDGAGSSQGSGGGCGGFLCLEAHYGDLVVRSSITAEGADPDGGGGSIALIADAGSIMLQPNEEISVRSNGEQGCGGEICVDAKGSVDAQSKLDASGGFGGGYVDLNANKDIMIAGGIDASGRGMDSCAGTMLAEAGFKNAVGAVQIASAIDLTAANCSGDSCGIGGFACILGCRVAVTAAGSIDAQAGQGGQIELFARDQLQVQGKLTATKKMSENPNATDGTIDFRHPIGTNPVVVLNNVRPQANVVALEKCAEMRGLVDCLVPCPACGNSIVEFPEDCDNGGGANPQSCDGCSIICQTEECDDGLNCTVDSCQPQRGCRHAPVELPGTPCYEPSEATPTATRSASPTASATPTRTATPTRRATIPTATRTPTTAATPTATGSPVNACTGDCDNSGGVSVNELVRGVNILLGSQQLSGCPTFDRNDSDTVTVDELVAAVRIALGDGCP